MNAKKLGFERNIHKLVYKHGIAPRKIAVTCSASELACRHTKSTCGASAFSVIYHVVGTSSANCVIEIENRVDLWYNEASEKCAEAEEKAWSNRKFI